jgi:hypothetical protein
MSKKNNKGTKRRIHANCLAREKAEREKRERSQAKSDAKAQREQEQQQHPQAATAASASASASASGFATPLLGVRAASAQFLKKRKPRPVRIKRGVVIKGIRIRDADDKRRALKLLSAEAKLKERRANADAAAAKALDAGMEGVEEAALAAASKSLFGGVKRSKAKLGKRVAIIAGRKKVMVACQKPEGGGGGGGGGSGAAAAAASDAMEN